MKVGKTGLSSHEQHQWNLLFAAWATVSAATLGSLFFSLVMQVPVCELCWYQRIAMYPLVVLLGVALFPIDTGVLRYAAPLAVIGWLIAIYQVLLVAGVIPEKMQPCVQGIPCSETHVALFGFLSIPVMSLLAFTLIGWLLLTVYRFENT